MNLKDYIFKKPVEFTLKCVEIADTCHIVYPQGHFDAATSEHAEKAIIEIVDKTNNLIFNLNELQYVSSAGLRVFLVIAKKMKIKNRSLLFCCLNHHVRQVFEISNFHTILEIHDSENDAVDKIKLNSKPDNLPTK